MIRQSLCTLLTTISLLPTLYHFALRCCNVANACTLLLYSSAAMKSVSSAYFALVVRIRSLCWGLRIEVASFQVEVSARPCRQCILHEMSVEVNRNKVDSRKGISTDSLELNLMVGWSCHGSVSVKDKTSVYANIQRREFFEGGYCLGLPIWWPQEQCPWSFGLVLNVA